MIAGFHRILTVPARFRALVLKLTPEPAGEHSAREDRHGQAKPLQALVPREGR